MGSYSIGTECCNNCVHWRPDRERKIVGCPPDQVITYTNQAYCPYAKHATLHEDCCSMFAHVGGVSNTHPLPPKGPSPSELYCESLLADVTRDAIMRAHRERDECERQKREMEKRKRETLLEFGMDKAASQAEQEEFWSLYCRMSHSDSAAYYEMGEAFYYGKHGATQNKRKAVSCYSTAAKKGFAKAEYSLGYCYYYGEGVEANDGKGREWLTQAERHGNSSAKTLLEKIKAEDEMSRIREDCSRMEEKRSREIQRCVDCEGMNPDASEMEKTLFMMRLSSASHDVDAQRDFGDWFAEGTFGATKDPVRSYNWYLRAAKGGDPIAQYRVGLAHYFGEGVDEDNDIAFIFFSQAAEQGNADAQYRLGECFQKGFGTDKNIDAAIKALELAAENGQSSAQHELGEIYYYGKDVPVDYASAFKWFTIAAEKKYSSTAMLGECYEYGRGVEKDIARARELYQEAADGDNDLAKAALERLENEA